MSFSMVIKTGGNLSCSTVSGQVQAGYMVKTGAVYSDFVNNKGTVCCFGCKIMLFS